MAVILQTFSNALSSFKMFSSLSIFRWNLFLRIQCVKKKKFLKNMLSTDTRFYGTEVVER